ncbi:M20 peptidase aminoacylase family protein [Bacillus sp. REN10]|uniref:M20 peptidase aminoacylase family protein n=1 Tax=Bacillus sp. REN10 TaxID=2782541 RepID=UPI001EEF675A|nr:M20 peptidase aminoacylase family protein [Bacillus sp. REN10]
MSKTDTRLESRLLDIFHHLHTHPEISWEETNTTAYIADLLRSEGVSVHTFDDCTGLVAEIGTGKPVIAVRADMDALWQEVNGTFQANHSCGHDAHMSIVIGAILQLKEQVTKGCVRFIFQPAEETGSGALKMVEKGVVDDVDYLFGIHLRPIEELPFGQLTPSIQHGAVTFLEGKIEGHDAHGARPHQNTNAIDIISTLNEQLKLIQYSPFEVYSAKITYVEAGSRNFNIIPGSAKFGMDLRAQKNNILEDMQKKVEQKIEHISQLYNVKIRYEWLDFTPGAEVSPEAEEWLRQGILQTGGASMLAEPLITPGSDDFHFYTIQRPHLKASMMGIGADLAPGLHHPNMTFNKNALKLGVDALTNTVLLALQ